MKQQNERKLRLWAACNPTLAPPVSVFMDRACRLRMPVVADVGPLLAKCQFAPCLMEDRELEVVTRMLEFMFSRKIRICLVTFAMAMVNATCAFGDQAMTAVSPLDLDKPCARQLR